MRYEGNNSHIDSHAREEWLKKRLRPFRLQRLSQRAGLYLVTGRFLQSLFGKTTPRNGDEPVDREVAVLPDQTVNPLNRRRPLVITTFHRNAYRRVLHTPLYQNVHLARLSRTSRRDHHTFGDNRATRTRLRVDTPNQ